MSLDVHNNAIQNEPKPSYDATELDGSKTMYILDIIAKGRDLVKTKLSTFVSSVVSTKKSVLCDIKSVVGEKLAFLESFLGQEAVEKTGSCEYEEPT